MTDLSLNKNKRNYCMEVQRCLTKDNNNKADLKRIKVPIKSAPCVI